MLRSAISEYIGTGAVNNLGARASSESIPATAKPPCSPQAIGMAGRESNARFGAHEWLNSCRMPTKDAKPCPTAAGPLTP
eukprot:scaffold93971_cov27-Tisochrysis_lutea.AAC.2